MIMTTRKQGVKKNASEATRKCDATIRIVKNKRSKRDKQIDFELTGVIAQTLTLALYVGAHARAGVIAGSGVETRAWATKNGMKVRICKYPLDHL